MRGTVVSLCGCLALGDVVGTNVLSAPLPKDTIGSGRASWTTERGVVRSRGHSHIRRKFRSVQRDSFSLLNRLGRQPFAAIRIGTSWGVTPPRLAIGRFDYFREGFLRKARFHSGRAWCYGVLETRLESEGTGNRVGCGDFG